MFIIIPDSVHTWTLCPPHYYTGWKNCTLHPQECTVSKNTTLESLLPNLVHYVVHRRKDGDPQWSPMYSLITHMCTTQGVNMTPYTLSRVSPVHLCGCALRTFSSESLITPEGFYDRFNPTEC